MNTGVCCDGGSVEVRATGDISEGFQPMLGEYQPTGEYNRLEDVDSHIFGPGNEELSKDPDFQANWVEAPKYRNIHGVQLSLEYGPLAPNGQYWALPIDLGRHALSYDKTACPVDTTDWRMSDIRFGHNYNLEYSANITISCK